jgi:hypothetical protein
MSYIAIVIALPDDQGVVKVSRRRAQEDADSLGFLQGIVGGYLEHLSSPDGRLDFWFHEEGKMEHLRLPINNVATDLLWLVHPAFRGQDVLVGNVVLTGHKGPETADAPEGLWERLAAMNWQCRIEFNDELSDE